ncbi:hypothetical protein GOA63_15930 [Sinorhizobium meliloti]|nr:hypothetical protein [Sinorhizobium meliloti]MDX0188768.1 hypothetical protein [Sinorhizobium meliloti]MQV08156.1 hypothetical protein [Sinorhizobium meliloti]MQV58643.1 hypothetical protein [Sinorhizobium meliloti]
MRARCLIELSGTSPLADLPPCGGDGRQARGGTLPLLRPKASPGPRRKPRSSSRRSGHRRRLRDCR